MKNESKDLPEESLALWRFAYISKIEELVRQDIPLMRALEQVAASPPPAPQGWEGRFYSPSTLEDWWYLYRHGGFEALRPRPRRDRGQPRRLSEEQARWVLEQVRSHPHTDVRVLHRRWQKLDPSLPSISSIYRLLARHGLCRGQRRQLAALPSGPTKSFEAAWPGERWMVDFSPGPFLRPESGKAFQTQLCLIVDDHSRLIPHAGYHTAADTAAFLATLKEAVLRRGIPHTLYTDNAKAFRGTHVRVVCANLGIRLLHTRPYHAWSKGKVERLLRTIQQDFEATLRLPGQAAGSLEELNHKLAWWIQSEYHLRRHSTTGMTPEERFGQQLQTVRHLEDPGRVDELFLTKDNRRVLKDGTIRLAGRLYEVDLALRGLKVELRFDPNRCDPVWVYYRGQFFGPARRLNRWINNDSSPGQSYEKDN